MNGDPHPKDRKLILELGILTQEIALLQEEMARKRKRQKALVVDLVQREVLSQARASRIAEVQRATITNWVKTWPGQI